MAGSKVSYQHPFQLHILLSVYWLALVLRSVTVHVVLCLVSISCVNSSPMFMVLMMTSDLNCDTQGCFVLFCFLGRQILCMFQCNPRSL